MAALLGDEYPAFLASYDAPASVGLRVNTLKISVEAFRSLAPFNLMPVPWCPTGFEMRTTPPTPLLRGEGSEPPPSLAEPVLRSSKERAVGGVGPGKHPYHAAGLYYLQDPSAMAAAELLDPQPGERVLDLAAAPGGKATHIASMMQGQGLLVANEIRPQRAWELAGNLERWGARNVAITNETPERLAERLPGFFDRVLVDAPCSGEGMMRKGEAARREWAPELVRGCALRQTGILDHAARLVRPGGRLVYATCTFNPEENEGTIARFLADHPDFTLVEPPQSPGFSPGRPEWIAVGAGLAPAHAPALRTSSPVALSGSASQSARRRVTSEQSRRPASGDASLDSRREQADGTNPLSMTPSPAGLPGRAALAAPDRSLSLDRTVRLWPHLAPGEGHFVAVLERATHALASPSPKTWRPTKLPKSVEDAYRSFCAAAFNMTSAETGIVAARQPLLGLAGHLPSGAKPPEGSIPDAIFSTDLALVGSYLYALPAGLPDLTGLRYLHPGWWLGTLKKDRFEPSHALALGLRLEDARRTLVLPADAPELAAYLRGETLVNAGEDGWTLVAVDGFPLGWGKRTGGRLKSHYPKGLRRPT